MKFLTPSSPRRIPTKKNNKGGCIKTLIIIGIIAALVYYAYKSSLLEIQTIEVTGINSDQMSEVQSYVLDAIGEQPFFEIEEGYISNLIAEKFPNLKLSESVYEFPGKFSLSLSERDEKYRIQAENGVFIADSEGFVLGTTTESTSSINMDVIYDRSLEVGKKVEDATIQAALIYSDLNQLVKIEDDQIHLDMENGGKIILPKNSAVSKVNELFTMLQKIIQKYTIDNRQIEFIDLRFSKPVIKYRE